MHDLARSAVLEVADSAAYVGEYLDSERVGEVTVLRFAALHPGYPCWHWSVAISGEEPGTINEIWMEPGEGALLAPEWKPWSERVRPGDLGAGDVIPTDEEDDRLQPGYVDEDDDSQLLQWELGLGRERVLSAEGLADAAERWRGGDDGPDSQISRLAVYPCSTCAWLLPIGGLLGQAFGVCAHDISPSDGHVVALDHGCGAHSDVKPEPMPIPVTEMLLDDEDFIAVSRASAAAELGEALSAADDMPDADQSDDDAGVTDVAPPKVMIALEESAE